MRKYYAMLTVLLAPIFMWAQHIHTFKNPVSPGSHLLTVNQKTILVDKIDVASGFQSWTTFDTALKVTSLKKMVTPGAEMLISQTYLPGAEKVIRIDQMLIEEQLHIGAFVFDTEGTLLHVKAIDVKQAPGTKIAHMAFNITQSPDKKSLALVQVQAHKDDSLAIAAVVLDDTLGIINRTGFSVFYEAILSDLQPPLLNNNEELFIAITDKFESYKLSADLKSYVFTKQAFEPQTFQISFDRKKLKNINLAILDDKLHLSALYSNSNDKEKIAGVVNTSYNFAQQQKSKDVYYVYSPESLKDLKKMFGIEGRKGHLLNYLSPLPFTTNAGQSFAVLLPEKIEAPRQGPKPVPPAVTGLGEIRQNLETVNKLVGTTPLGSTKPLTVTEANTYAATIQQGAPKNIPNTDDIYRNPYIQNKAGQNQKDFKKNLLFFSFEKGQAIRQFARLKPIQDEEYDFFAYIPEADGYSALHYLWPSFKRSYLNKTTINSKGKKTEKNVFEDKTKVLLMEYPFIATEKNLLAIYQDKISGEMGLIKLQL